MEEYDGFDLERMFIGDLSGIVMLEIGFRTAVMYLFAMAVVRFIGKRGLGQITPFEFIVVIALGSATGDPMLSPEIPLVQGMIVLTMVVVLQRLLVWASGRSEAVEHFIDSVPALLIENGQLREDVVRREGFATDELMMQLRQAGIRNVGQVQYAWLEPSGQISVFASESPGRPAQSTFPTVVAKSEMRPADHLGS
jgi:uncharacterized membrane protein YcaP (DUF421 family)